MAVRGLHHRDLCPDALEPHAVHPTALDRPLALQLESRLDEERRRGRQVVDHDAHALHTFGSSCARLTRLPQLERLSVADPYPNGFLQCSERYLMPA